MYIPAEKACWLKCLGLQGEMWWHWWFQPARGRVLPLGDTCHSRWLSDIRKHGRNGPRRVDVRSPARLPLYNTSIVRQVPLMNQVIFLSQTAPQWVQLKWLRFRLGLILPRFHALCRIMLPRKGAGIGNYHKWMRPAITRSSLPWFWSWSPGSPS